MEIKEYKKIVGLDPYLQKFIIYDKAKNEIRLSQDVKSNKHNIHSSFLQTKYFITTKIKISKNIPQEDIEDILTTKAYEELDLDPTIEYKITYTELPTDLHSKDREFQLFLVDYETLHNIFDPYIEKMEFLDFIFPIPTLFQALYTNDILINYETHIFIYFQNDDAFLTIYRNGQFIYTISLKFSFEYMAQRLSELKGAEVTQEELIENLRKYGLKIPDFQEVQYYMQIFSELFMHINDVLIYAKKSFELENIDKIFISSDIGQIAGIEEYAQTYLGQKAYDFEFDYGFENNDSSVTHIHSLLILKTKECHENEECVNFTIFQRPPSIWKRPSGQLIATLAASLIIAFAYPMYNYILAYKYQLEKILLQKEYTKIHAKRVSLEAQINSIKNEIKKIDNQINVVLAHLNEKKESLKKIYDKKVHYTMKAATVAEFAQDLKKYKIHLLDLNNTNKTFNLNVAANDDKKITELIKYITFNKADKYSITTKDINKTGAIYTSTLKVIAK